MEAAVLDFNLGKGETSLPVAEELKNKHIPFFFLTGYTDATVSLPDTLSGIRRITKPFRNADLINAINGLLRAPS